MHACAARCPHYVMVALRTVPVQPKPAISRFHRSVFLLIRLRFDWRVACKSPYSSTRSISFFLSSFLSQTIVPSETKSVGFAINMSTALLVERLDAALCSGSGKNDDAVGLPTETD